VPRQTYEVGTLAVDGWAVRFGTAMRGRSPPRPLLAVPNVTAPPISGLCTNHRIAV